MKKGKNAVSFRGISLLLTVMMLMSVLFVGLTNVFAESSAVDNNLIANGSFERAEKPSEKLNAWTMDEGFSVSADGAGGGKNMLAYAGEAEGTATSDAFAVEQNEEYILIAKLKRKAATDVAKVCINGVEAEVSSTDTGVWTRYTAKFNSAENTELSVSVKAKGNVAFDDIQVAMTYTLDEIECVVNGDFDGEGGWTNVPLRDVSDIGGTGKAAGPVISSQDVKVDTDTWYLYSADIYRDNLVTWKYLDMFPTAENIRLRGYKANEWETIGALWYSGDNKNTTARLVVEGGWDNVSVGSSSDISNSFIDNVSLKKVTVSDELISDPDFTSNGWKILQNGEISSTGNESTGSFKSTMTQASQGKAIALANDGNAIPVEKNTTYVLSAWVRIDGGTRTLKAVLDMNDIENELQVESTTYNHDSKGNYWVLMTGVWNSGDNSEVTIRAAIEPTIEDGAVSSAYIDTVSFRKAQPMEYGKSLVENGGFEDYTMKYNVENWNIPETGLSLSDDAANGKISVVLKDKSMSSDDIALVKNTDYVLSAWVKAANGGSAKISLGSAANLASKKTGEWEYLSTTFNSGENTSVKAVLEATGTAQFDALYLDKAINVFDVAGTKLSQSAQREELASADTSLIIAVDNDKMYVEKMLSKDTGHEWISPEEAQEMPLVPYVNGKATDWKYEGKSVDETDGKLLTLTFTNADPAMELKAYWQAYPGEEGPVQYWAEIINKSGGTLSFEYKDVISGDLVVTADSEAKLNYFERQTYTNLKIRNFTHCDDITAGYKNVNVTRNEAAQTSNDYRLPYQVIETSTGQGLYYGYYYGFGRMTLQTGADPTKIRIGATLGESGTVTRKIDAGDMDGDGVADPDLNLKIPGMFFGTYEGSLDNGCNRMKDWFWNHRMTKTLRENANEPLVELHLPYNSEAEWTKYLSEHDVASWGVQLLKQDYWWTVPNSPPADGSFNWDLHQKWTPDATKWPNGMVLGELAHSHGMQQSLYFCDTFELTDLLDWTGRNKNLNALSSRLRDWKIDYYRSDFAMQGPYEKAIYNYAAYEGYMWMIDQMIADEELPTFRYESCSGGGTLKDFTSLQRMTFLTNEDSGRAMPNRAVTYTDLYMINPAQIKMDIAIDWPAIEGPITDQAAYDYYIFRTGLLGAIMICPSTNLAGFTDHQIEVAKETYGIYNSKHREIIRNCDVYHILPSPNGIDWDGIEYFNEDLGMGTILLYRPSSNCDYTEKKIYPDGLKKDAIYEAVFEDNTDLNVTKTGAELMSEGILVRMDKNYDSEIIWLKELSDEDIKVKNITIYGGADMKIGEKITLKASISPINATNTEVEWSSSDEETAMVSSEGVVKAWGPGKVTITATAKDGSGVSASVEITVLDEPLGDGWTYVNNIDPSISYGEGSRPGTGGGGYYGGDETHVSGFAELTFVGTKVKWLSAKNLDCGKADVYIDGELAGTVDLYNAGLTTATVFESENLEPGEHTIKVVPLDVPGRPYVPVDAFAYIPLLKAEMVIIRGDDTVTVGNDIQLTAKVLPSTVGNTDVIWSSSDEKIATVDSTGKVTAICAGTVEITAAAAENEEVFAKKTITVKDVEDETVYAESVKVAGKAQMKAGETQVLQATVLPENADDKTVTWSSSNEKIAAVDAQGKVTAIAQGDVTITASVPGENGAVTGEFKIEIKAADKPEDPDDPTPSKPTKPDDPTPSKPTKPDDPKPSSPAEPDKPNDPDHPKTGDEFNIALWIILAVIAAAGVSISAVIVKRRRVK